MRKHGNRSGGDLSHVDPTRTGLNLHHSDWDDPRDLAACMRAVSGHHRARQRKGCPLGTHVLLTASPGYFRPQSPSAAGTWDKARLDAWVAANVAWLNRRFPDQVAAWRVDLDETTPHFDAFIVPINVRVTKTGKRVPEISHRAAFSTGKGPRSYEALQDEYAAAMAHLGLKRGRPARETGARHVPPARYRRALVRDAAAAQALNNGMKLWADGRMRRMRWSSNGEPLADFCDRISPARRPGILAALRPAWRELVSFAARVEREMASAVADFVVGVEADRSEARRLLAEASWSLDLLRAAGLTPPPETEGQIASLMLELVR
jgi:hypothetical protein